MTSPTGLRHAGAVVAAALLFTLVVGCTAEAPATGVQNGTVAAADGLTLHYDTRGSGDTALVFVHCWACDRAYWREQLDVFADRYRVVSLDLAGHGASGLDREDWSLAELGDDVVAVVRHLGLERVVLVGHSMGGPVALHAARELPGTVVGIVAVDTLHNAEMQFPKETVAIMAAGFEADFAGAMDGAVRGMLGEGVDPTLTEWVVERACAADPGSAVGLMKDFGDFGMAAAMRDAGVPIRAINAAPSSQFQPATEIEINRKYADYDAEIMEGVGHFLQLQDPEAFNRLLAAAIEELDAAR